MYVFLEIHFARGSLLSVPVSNCSRRICCPRRRGSCSSQSPDHLSPTRFHTSNHSEAIFWFGSSTPQMRSSALSMIPRMFDKHTSGFSGRSSIPRSMKRFNEGSMRSMSAGNEFSPFPFDKALFDKRGHVRWPSVALSTALVLLMERAKSLQDFPQSAHSRSRMAAKSSVRFSFTRFTHDRRPLRGVIASVLDHHPHGALAHFR